MKGHNSEYAIGWLAAQILYIFNDITAWITDTALSLLTAVLTAIVLFFLKKILDARFTTSWFQKTFGKKKGS